MPSHCSLPPMFGFDVSVRILPRKVVVCRNFSLHAVATFWVMSLVEIYPGRATSREIDEKGLSYWEFELPGVDNK